MAAGDLVIRNAEIDGVAGWDVRLAGGRIEQVGRHLARAADEGPAVYNF